MIDDLAVVVATLEAPPASLGVTHWSARLLGKHLGISFASVARIWWEHDLKPWKRETFKFSTDPELDATVGDVVGLYLNPPEKAVIPACPRRPPTTTSATAPRACSRHWRSPPAQ